MKLEHVLVKFSCLPPYALACDDYVTKSPAWSKYSANYYIITDILNQQSKDYQYKVYKVVKYLKQMLVILTASYSTCVFRGF